MGLASGASLLVYRYYTRPTTLSVAVGSIDGEAAKAMSGIASRLACDERASAAQGHRQWHGARSGSGVCGGKADLAVVRGDVGDLSKAQAVVVVSHMVVLVVAPPGSTIDSIDKLKGRRVGVIGGDANARVVEVLSREYGLDRAKVFKDIALPDARRAVQSKEVNALLVVIPLAEKYLSLVRDVISAGVQNLAGAAPDRICRGDRTSRTRL